MKFLKYRKLPYRLRLHEQIKQVLFEQIKTELIHTAPKFEQIQAILFAQVIYLIIFFDQNLASNSVQV